MTQRDRDRPVVLKKAFKKLIKHSWLPRGNRGRIFDELVRVSPSARTNRRK